MPVLKFATGLGMMVLTIIIHALFMVGGAKKLGVKSTIDLNF
jgi:hypothetical protein